MKSLLPSLNFFGKVIVVLVIDGAVIGLANTIGRKVLEMSNGQFPVLK